MAVRKIHDEDINQAIRESRRDIVVVDATEKAPREHQKINSAITAARARGTWEVDAETGKVVRVDGKPVRKRK